MYIITYMNIPIGIPLGIISRRYRSSIHMILLPISYFITIIFITYITNIIIITNNNNRIITMNSNNTIIMRNNNITRSNITISIKIRFLSDLVSIQHFRNLENSMLWLAWLTRYSATSNPYWRFVHPGFSRRTPSSFNGAEAQWQFSTASVIC